MLSPLFQKAACVCMLLASFALFGGNCDGFLQRSRLVLEDVKAFYGSPIREVFPADNCASSSPMRQDIRGEKMFLHEVKVFANSDVQSRIKPAWVKQDAFALYKISNEADKSVIIIPVDVPAGEKRLYEIEWRETWREGTIELGEPDGKPEGTYRIRTDMACEVIGVTVDSCK